MTSLQDLLAQKAAIEREITKTRNDGRANAIAQILATMSEHGLRLEDLSKAQGQTGGARDGVRRPVAPKYRDRQSGATWSGRGLKPLWLNAALKAGKTLDDFAIAASDGSV